MTRDPLIRALGLLYVLGVIVTFGHAWAHFSMDDARLVGSLLAGVAWPFYWSGWFWSHLA